MIKKNLLGIMIVILIAGAFVGGYVLGRRSVPQMPGRMPTMGGGQPPGGQPGNAGQQQPGQRPAEKSSDQETGQEENSDQRQLTKTDQPQMAQQGNPGQEQAMMPGANPGDSQEMTEEMRAVIAKAREEGKSREEIQAMIAKLREQGDAGQTQQPEQGQPVEQPNASETQSPVQQQRSAETVMPTPAPNTHEFYGTAAPSAEVNVQSEQGGTIIVLKGKEGDSVNKGELLVQFDDSDARLNLEKAQSSKNSTVQQVQQAETNLKAAQTNLKRNQELFKDGLISQQQMDDLQNKVEAAQVSLNNARENVKQADTQITQLEKELEDYAVRAPISGIIDTKNYNLQEIYRANDVLYHIVNIDEVYINVDVPETYIKQIREGIPVTVTFNALGEQRFAGTVDTVLPSSTTANRTFTAKVLVKNPDHAIKPGMFASVQIALGE